MRFIRFSNASTETLNTCVSHYLRCALARPLGEPDERSAKIMRHTCVQYLCGRSSPVQDVWYAVAACMVIYTAVIYYRRGSVVAARWRGSGALAARCFRAVLFFRAAGNPPGKKFEWRGSVVAQRRVARCYGVRRYLEVPLGYLRRSGLCTVLFFVLF